MISFLLFLTLVSGALIVKLPLLGLFFMTIIIYIAYVKRLKIWIVLVILCTVTASSTYFYTSERMLKEDIINEFLIYDYKYQNNNINYIVKNKNKKFNMYIDTKNPLPIGLKCTGLFDVTLPKEERNFIKRNPNTQLKIQKINGNIYMNETDLNCRVTNRTLPMKLNNLKYQYTMKVIESSNHEYIGDMLMLSIGNKMTLDDEFFSSLQKLGIYHLYVISGTHVAYIMMILLFVFTKLRIPIEYVKILIIICLLLFLVVNIFSPSVLRAVLMAVMLIITSFFNKKPYLTVISITAIIQFLINPYIILHAGFQLSYVTTFLILLTRELFKDENALLQMFLLTIICEVSTIVIILFHFNEVSISGIVMNFIFGPIFSWIIFPSVIIFNISIFTYFSPILDALFHKVFSFNGVLIQFFSQLIEHRIPIKNISILSMIVLLILSFLLIKIILQKTYMNIIIITCTYISVIFLSSFNYSNDIKLVMVDVGQGDAFLIIDEKKNKTILIDTGGKYYRNDFEIPLSEKTILPYLKEHGIRHIDLLVLSHMDNDHIGEAPHIAEKLKVKNIYVNFQDEKFDLNTFNNHFSNSTIIDSNDVKQLKVGRVLLNSLNENKSANNSNDQSIVLDVDIIGYHILMLGDLSLEYEEEILERVNALDIVKIGHHGSETSTSNALANYPFSIALISSGVNNRYGHPHDSVVSKLLEKEILNTQETGMVEITFKKEKYCIKTKLSKNKNKCYKKRANY